MTKMSNLCLLLGEIIEHGEAILEAAKEIRNIFSEEAETPALPEKAAAQVPKKVEKKEPAATAKELSFTDVRAKLAEKSSRLHRRYQENPAEPRSRKAFCDSACRL